MNKNFDEILDSFRDDQPTASQVEEAGARVRQQLFGAATSAATATEVSRITGCADFRTLLASYADGTLPEARRMLVQDHLRECGACRRALDEARGLRPKVVPFEVPRAPKKANNFQKWAIAAGMFAAVGTSSWGILKYLLPGSGKARNVASIQDVRGGSLYKGVTQVAQGLELAEAESIRTPMGTRATVKLEDGSLIEVNERSEISISKGWSGTTIRLTSGNIIVQAAKQRSGKLMVSTPDALVSVKGTIFSVNRGVKGSRVSVVEGSVQVDPASGGTQMLKPGDQTTTDPSLAKVAIKDEVAWSENSARYLSLLGELNALSQKIDAIPGPGLRYSSPLTRYIKPDTAVFVAIPNLGDTLAEAKKVFDRQLLDSPSLRKSWEEATNEKSRAATDEIITEIQQFASYLGPEVVLMLDGSTKSPIALAEVKRDGLAQFLEDKIAHHAKGANTSQIRGSVYEIHKNMLIFGKDSQTLKVMMSAVDQGGLNAASPFRDRIEQAYQAGAGWLFCANMEQILGNRVQKTSGVVDLGVDSAKYLVLERKQVSGKTQNVASLSFSEQRHGVMAWLAEPSALTSLDFVSPDAGLAFAAVTKRPRLVVEEMLALAGSKKDDLADLKNKTGIDPVEDLAEPLGSEFAFASDGPVLQSLSWKLAVEMNGPQRFQQSVEKLIAAINKEQNKAQLKLETSEADGRTFYAVTAQGFPFAIHYTFVDNYLLAGANRALLVTAIKNRQNGYVLTRSEKFRSQIPYGANPNFSAIFYHNVAGALAPVADQLKSTGYGTDEFRKGLDSVGSMAPGMVAIYGEPTRITAATHGDFFGLNAGMLAGLDKGGAGMLGMLTGATTSHSK
ncbi:hypothetical protein F183_A19920 [Bryobacterales bacterium F-183]|nr:hypothetical protein F183_A19920 [Bryobacterales bacterium F-183]